jgi:hypothetical protein
MKTEKRNTIQLLLKFKCLLNNCNILKIILYFCNPLKIYKEMKKTINFFGKCLFIIVLFVGFSAVSQNKNLTPDARLYQCYEKTYLDNLVKTNPDQILYLNYYLDNAYYVVSLKNAEKPITGIDINILFEKSKKGVVTSLPFKEKVYKKANFNVLKYNFQTGDLDSPTYIWKEAGIAIVFHPEKYIKEDFNMLQKAKK